MTNGTKQIPHLELLQDKLLLASSLHLAFACQFNRTPDTSSARETAFGSIFRTSSIFWRAHSVQSCLDYCVPRNRQEKWPIVLQNRCLNCNYVSQIDSMLKIYGCKTCMHLLQQVGMDWGRLCCGAECLWYCAASIGCWSCKLAVSVTVGDAGAGGASSPRRGRQDRWNQHSLKSEKLQLALCTSAAIDM